MRNAQLVRVTQVIDDELVPATDELPQLAADVDGRLHLPTEQSSRRPP
jgi:hypothetical protein